MKFGTDVVAQTRFDNAMALFDEFVHSNVKHADAATLRGLESRFALRLQIQPSYWSQIKGRSRQIGERLARQFEQLCRKPPGWMDEAHGQRKPTVPTPMPLPGRTSLESAQPSTPAEHASAPMDDDERFIVGLVLTYYRRHPQRARTRLLELLGEVLGTPEPSEHSSAPSANAKPPTTRRAAAPVLTGDRARLATLGDGGDDEALWARAQAAVAPLKQKR